MRKFAGLLPFVCALALFGRPMAERAVPTDPYLFKLTGVQEFVDSNGHNVNGSLVYDSVGLSTSTTGQSPLQGGTTSLVQSTGGTTSTTSTSSTSGSTTSTTGGTPINWYLVIANPNSSVICGTDSHGNSPTSVSASTMVSNYAYPWGSGIGGWAYYVGESTGGPPITADTISVKHTFGSSTSSSFTFQEGMIGVGGAGTTYKWEEITVGKQSTTAVSVDSRRMYGQPNAQGQAGLNANAPARPINFYGWYYKGGLFTGNAPFSSQDQSGTSRLQAYISTIPTGDAAMSACLTMYFLASATGFTDSYTLQSYDATTDPNVSVTAQNATWTNAWSPSSDPLLPGSYSMPLSSPQYMNFNIAASGDTQAFAPYVLLAMKPEPAPGSTPQTWSYYVSAAYAQQNLSAADEVPRAWVAYQTRYKAQ